MYQRALLLEDKAKALKWFECAAEPGNAESVLQIAMQFQPAACNAKDVDEAVSWFRRTAYLGDASAMFKLGVCLQQRRRDGQGDCPRTLRRLRCGVVVQLIWAI
jgi:TPR repeat protein